MTVINKKLKVSDFLEQYTPGILSPHVYSLITNQTVISPVQPKQWTNPPFQRNFVWTQEQQCLFIESLFNKEVYTDIVLVEVTDELKDIYTTLRTNNNYNSVTIDGQNRSKTIWRFITNQLAFSGTICHNGGAQIYDKYVFSNLPVQVQRRFLNNVDIGIKVITEYSASRLNSIFIKVNEGESLNDQEKRNASPSKIPEWTSMIGTSHYDLFSKFQGMTPKKMLRSSHREKISHMLMKIHSFESGVITLAYKGANLEININKSKLKNSKHKETNALYREVEEDPNHISQGTYDYVQKSLIPAFEDGCDALASMTTLKGQIMRKFSKSSIELYILMHYLLRKKADISSSNISNSDLWYFVLDNEKLLQKGSMSRAAQDVVSGSLPTSAYFHLECTRIHVSDAFYVVSEQFLSEFNNSIDELVEGIQEYTESRNKQAA